MLNGVNETIWNVDLVEDSSIKFMLVLEKFFFTSVITSSMDSKSLEKKMPVRLLEKGCIHLCESSVDGSAFLVHNVRDSCI